MRALLAIAALVVWDRERRNHSGVGRSGDGGPATTVAGAFTSAADAARSRTDSVESAIGDIARAFGAPSSGGDLGGARQPRTGPEYERALNNAVETLCGDTSSLSPERVRRCRDEAAARLHVASSVTDGARARVGSLPSDLPSVPIQMTPDEQVAVSNGLAVAGGASVGTLCVPTLLAVQAAASKGATLAAQAYVLPVTVIVCGGLVWLLNEFGILEPVDKFVHRAGGVFKDIGGAIADGARAVGGWVEDGAGAVGGFAEDVGHALNPFD